MEGECGRTSNRKLIAVHSRRTRISAPTTFPPGRGRQYWRLRCYSSAPRAGCAERHIDGAARKWRGAEMELARRRVPAGSDLAQPLAVVIVAVAIVIAANAHEQRIVAVVVVQHRHAMSEAAVIVLRRVDPDAAIGRVWANARVIGPWEHHINLVIDH